MGIDVLNRETWIAWRKCKFKEIQKKIKEARSEALEEEAKEAETMAFVYKKRDAPFYAFYSVPVALEIAQQIRALKEGRK